MGLAKVAAAAGYEPVYKGKLHIMSASGPNDTAVPDDAGQYGWTRCVSQGGRAIQLGPAFTRGDMIRNQ